MIVSCFAVCFYLIQTPQAPLMTGLHNMADQRTIGQGWIYWGGVGWVPFFLIKKKKLQIIDSNLNNTANT